MTYKADRKNLWKRNNQWYFRKAWRDANGNRKWYITKLDTVSLSIARKRLDEIMGRWNEVMNGAEFEWSWQGEYHRTTVKEKRLDQVVEQYIKHKQSEKLAPSSIYNIRYSLNNLIKHLGSGFNYTNLNSENIDDFKLAIGRHRTPHGVNVDVRNIRAFCNWLFQTQRINRQLPIKQVKEPKKKPQYLTETDIVAIFSLETISDQMKRFFSFYLSTGLRRSAPFYGHMEGNWLVISADAPCNKSKREIEVCLDEALQKIWKEMIELKEEWLASGKKMENLTGKITKEFKRAVRECGLNDKHHLHNTRHTFAIKEWLRTGNIYAVKEQLAHSTVGVTEGYTVHKRSKISADFPSLTKQIAEAPKRVELVEGEHLLVNKEGE